MPENSSFPHGGEGRTLLVTGGAGFVGSNLAHAFKARYPALRVISLDNLRRRGSELNLPRLRDAGILFLHGDIRNPEDLQDLDKIDVLLECSAEPAVLPGYGSERSYTIQTNLSGTVNCLEMATRLGATLVFLSTSRVYPIDALNNLAWREEETRFRLEPQEGVPGASENGIDVDFTMQGARSLYGATKLCSELLIQEYVDGHRLRAVINRCGVIAGPWQMGKLDQGVAAHWLFRHHFGGPLNYIGYRGSGKQVRDFLHIDDLADLIDMQLSDPDRSFGHTFNVGGGRDNSLSLVELTDRCRRLSGKKVPIGRQKDDRPGDIRIYLTDNSRVTRALGWRPRRTADRALEDLNEWITHHREDIQRALPVVE